MHVLFDHGHLYLLIIHPPPLPSSPVPHPGVTHVPFYLFLRSQPRSSSEDDSNSRLLFQFGFGLSCRKPSVIGSTQALESTNDNETTDLQDDDATIVSVNAANPRRN